VANGMGFAGNGRLRSQADRQDRWIDAGLAWPFALASMTYSGVDSLVSSDERANCAEAAAKLGHCPHLRVVPMSWSPPTPRCVEAAFKYYGCAFLYKGTVICHDQPNLDTKGKGHWLFFVSPFISASTASVGLPCCPRYCFVISVSPSGVTRKTKATPPPAI
jgi:hypothetical protein